MSRIGLGIRANAVSGVLVSRGRPLRAVLRERSPVPELAATVSEVINALAPARFVRPRVAVAVGPASAQTRLLQRLPADADSLTMATIVRTNPGRFFLKDGAPLVVSGAEKTAASECWAAAIDETVMEAVRKACRSNGLCLEAVLPSAVVLSAVLVQREFRWRDGGHEMYARVGATRRLQEVRINSALPAALLASDEPRLRPELDAIWRGSCTVDSALYMDAFGATLVSRSDPLAIRPGTNVWPERTTTPGWRMMTAATAFLITTCALIVAPGFLASRVASRAARELTTLAPARREAALLTRDLNATTAAIEQLALFARQRRSLTIFLASLTAALEADVTLINLRADRSGGLLVAIAPRVADVVAQLRDVPQITQPEIVGPITPETSGERLERATIRFQWSGSGTDSSRSGALGKP